ncbi:Fpg/Nei family DNA glycosylase [Paenarthrobacter aurescens]|uniref:DNA-(apurinic or apyrimidinic site) lyase n=1 Tax=Paenarthrobacter aurescens TaxID=43663 RepID=A0A4Y3NMG6_PAEAU|nr:DNA-formamidopyrimidine glycosylase family protein [Paenarthrobacter aurescens]MDO6143816.1 Fpg/Nei family DNA glycosylase [Paenarthrobacter aurescens]MDO6147663.1 Fpg/Nei family DNA glycosylase [Paenarthrobacter aurescens]MDO6158907.1 Fpg/Nei family DNA glycosylase [Paenarthrobacter aurescens]MDO6162891.1 Fpg/Nei family DNA glycosylase [Paenarthrobacter aurescens]GEB20376.1 formamidopyrimidine-DNA glycosylase [Paenarthrobacter aurescens]
MPEGHSVHRLARQFQDVFGGRRLDVSSPQGRFTAGAELLTGHTMLEATAHGKQFFLRFDHELFLHVHLGLYGAWSFGGDRSFTGASSIGAPRRIGEREAGPSSDTGEYTGPPAPVGAVRVRLVSGHGWADLRGATTCAAITSAEAQAVLDRLGPDPLRNRPGDREEFSRRLRRRKTPVALLLMDQSVLAGVGNIYRAEVLFRQAVDPWTPGSSIDAETAGRLWDDTVATMSDGVRDGRIVTTPSALWTGSGVVAPDADAHFVYKRDGLPCRACGTLVGMAEIGARKLYWCPGCQV